MREIENLRGRFNERLKEAGQTTVYGAVVSVDEVKRMCDVKVGGITYEGVLLYSIENSDKKGFVMIPKQDSGVIISRIASSNRMFVEMFSEVDKVLFTAGEKVEMMIDDKEVIYRNDKTTIHAVGDKVEITTPETVFNSGDFDGMVKIRELEKNLESIKKFVDSMNAAIPGAFAAVLAGTSANGALGQANYRGAMAGKNIKLDDMENPKIKH